MPASTDASLVWPSGVLSPPAATGFPAGYRVGVTRYADVILRDALPQRYADLIAVLDSYRVHADELVVGGGNRSSQTARFDAGLHQRGWGKRTVTVEKRIDGRLIHQTRGHEIDMFGPGEDEYPGVAVEVEWNNKDPFFDRDLLNFQALHREGALAVGVIFTRGPQLQQVIGPTIRGDRSLKFGRSTTHWDKLEPRINLGGGGECPLIAIGIEPDRVDGFAPILQAFESGECITPSAWVRST